MAQSALTVTPPSPTPPTNMAFTGVTGPNPPNYTKNTYLNPFNVAARGTGTNGSMAPTDGFPSQSTPGVGVNQSPPPFFDDGVTPGNAGNSPSLLFATNTAALASGTGATSGGTENTYPGTGTPGTNPFGLGAVPASTSAAHEGSGLENTIVQSYPVWASGTGLGVLGVFVPGERASYIPPGGVSNWAAGDPGGPLRTFSAPGSAAGGTQFFTGVASSPNSSHASSLSPLVNPTLTSIASIASGGGTGTCSATGTGFTRQSVLWVNGIAYPTTFVSATNITAITPKKATPGTLPVNVVTGGVVTTATVNWTFS